jgi:hypothetical protein
MPDRKQKGSRLHRWRGVAKALLSFVVATYSFLSNPSTSLGREPSIVDRVTAVRATISRSKSRQQSDPSVVPNASDGPVDVMLAQWGDWRNWANWNNWNNWRNWANWNNWANWKNF